jgi:hypothetical protein
MTSKAQTLETPIWCATADNRSRATLVISSLWIVTLSLAASAVICPYPVWWRTSEAIISAYLFFYLVPMTRQLVRSFREARAMRASG